MDLLVTIGALVFLMFVAYRGFSVILFAPVAALLAVLFTDPSHVLPFFSGVFMTKAAGFVQLYFPVFMLGAIFGKLIELSGFAKTITHWVIRIVGANKAMLAVVLVCAILTYGGVSLFVVAFAVYPFAVELFKAAGIPKRLIPGTIALGAFTFTMDALPGTPQIQNIIPTTFFHTTTWAAPRLGLIGALFVFTVGMVYLEFRRRQALAREEGYGDLPETPPLSESLPLTEKLPHPVPALIPLVLVGALNRTFTGWFPSLYAKTFEFPGMHVEALDISKVTAIWSIEGALVVGILAVTILAFGRIKSHLAAGINLAIGGAMLASLNTASEYGFGAVISALPGFKAISNGMAHALSNPLMNEAVTTTTLSGITGSASGGMSIALATMGQTYLEQATRLGISPEVLHRVASMASGGMDTLPHNGAVITLLAITGLTHKQAYKDIFAMTLIKTMAVFVVIACYSLFRII